jgi:transposase InsO family protein
MARKRQAFPELKEDVPDIDAASIDAKQYLKDVAKELHKPIKHKFPTRSVIVGHKDQTWSMDLADMSTWKDSNDGITFILTSVDVYTRWAAAKPLKSKSAKDVLDAIKDIVADSKRKPELLWVDEGTEFKNRELTAWRKANHIGLYHTYGRGKSVIVERFNRTLKTMMWRELTARNTHKWIDILPELVATYNNTKHSKLKMTPNEASKHPEKAAKVWATLRKEQREPTKPKFKVVM